jgi:hypothetical protein
MCVDDVICIQCRTSPVQALVHAAACVVALDLHMYMYGDLRRDHTVTEQDNCIVTTHMQVV